jgi:DNA-binding transcriptional MerR regulator
VVTEPDLGAGDDGDGDGHLGTRPVYSIGAVVKMLEMDASTLRAWEERYGLVVPRRSRGGQRIYSRDDLAHLRFVIETMAKGASPGDAHRLLAEQLRAPGGVMTPPQPESPNVMVLLAERDRYAAELSEYLLRTEGYDVCVVMDPGEAKRRAAERHPDLSLVELMIPGGGLRLCQELASRGTPVLAMSALDLADEALAAGAGAFVPKPINPLQLVSTVRDLLGQSALTGPRV